MTAKPGDQVPKDKKPSRRQTDTMSCKPPSLWVGGFVLTADAALRCYSLNNRLIGHYMLLEGRLFGFVVRESYFFSWSCLPRSCEYCIAGLCVAVP